MTADGLVTIRSNYGPKETMDRLESEVKGKGLTVFAHVDHAAGATAVGLTLDPTDLLIFGNAKGGTPLMQAVQTIGSKFWSGRMPRAKRGCPTTIRTGWRSGTGSTALLLRPRTAWPAPSPAWSRQRPARSSALPTSHTHTAARSDSAVCGP